MEAALALGTARSRERLERAARRRAERSAARSRAVRTRRASARTDDY